jgi:hypothetical protein
MLEQAKIKTLPLVTRAADFAPAAQACCGVCRTCTTTNVFTAAAAALAGIGYWVARRLRLFSHPE